MKTGARVVFAYGEMRKRTPDLRVLFFKGRLCFSLVRKVIFGVRLVCLFAAVFISAAVRFDKTQTFDNHSDIVSMRCLSCDNAMINCVFCYLSFITMTDKGLTSLPFLLISKCR